MASATIFKKVLTQKFDWFRPNLTRWRARVFRTLLNFKNRTFQNSKWQTAAILKNPKNRHISATYWSILMIFGRFTQSWSPKHIIR